MDDVSKKVRRDTKDSTRKRSPPALKLAIRGWDVSFGRSRDQLRRTGLDAAGSVQESDAIERGEQSWLGLRCARPRASRTTPARLDRTSSRVGRVADVASARAIVVI